MLELDFKLQPSWQYLILLAVTLVACVGIVAALHFSLWMKGITLLLIIFYGVHLLWAVALLHGKHAICRFKREHDGRWSLHTPSGIYSAELRGDTTVTQMVTVLRFQVQNQRHPWSSVVFRDSLVARDYRELLVALRTLTH